MIPTAPPLPQIDLPATLAEFQRLEHTGQLTPALATQLATAAAAAFLHAYADRGEYLGEAITLLCDMSMLDDPAVSQAGLHGLFPSLIEWLGDAFDPAACLIYQQLFVQVIQHCRQHPQGAPLDAQLRRFGLVTVQDLLQRAARVRRLQRFDPKRAGPIKKIFILSRVTLGADIAVTSVVLAKLKQVCPDATLLLLGDPKAEQLFAGDARVCLSPLAYPRGGGLSARLATWLAVVEAIEREAAGLQSHEYLIVDPDSRLAQLGLLPVVADERSYHFFESRSYRAPGLHSLSELTAHWLNAVFGATAPIAPYFAPSPANLAWAKRLLTEGRAGTPAFVVSINFGVGANPRKRLPDPFEETLVAGLLQRGALVLLDSGGEKEEIERIGRLTASLQQNGIETMTAVDATACNADFADARRARLIVWRGSIGGFGALIGQSDAYIGYDSACQHLAAALGVPTIDIFTGFSSPLMPARWYPHGPGPAQMFVVERGESLTQPQLNGVVAQVLAGVARFR